MMMMDGKDGQFLVSVVYTDFFVNQSTLSIAKLLELYTSSRHSTRARIKMVCNPPVCITSLMRCAEEYNTVRRAAALVKCTAAVFCIENRAYSTIKQYSMKS